MEYIEHNKLEKVNNEVNSIVEFLEWFQGVKNVSYMKEHGENLVPSTFYFSKYNVALEFFGIDWIKLEKERKEMLKAYQQ